MPNTNKPSLPVIKRLPRYYRYLGDMASKGVLKISSSELARLMGTTASQVRQDLNCFGGFGQQGIGYNVKMLHEELGLLIFSPRAIPTILIGAGNLGHTMANYFKQDTKGFELLSAFDLKEDIVGEKVCGVAIRNISELEDFCREYEPKVAVLCIPRSDAQSVVDQLVNLGVKGFWNFSHYDFRMNYKDIIVENVHLGDSLATLSYEVNNMKV